MSTCSLDSSIHIVACTCVRLCAYNQNGMIEIWVKWISRNKSCNMRNSSCILARAHLFPCFLRFSCFFFTLTPSPLPPLSMCVCGRNPMYTQQLLEKRDDYDSIREGFFRSRIRLHTYKWDRVCMCFALLLIWFFFYRRKNPNTTTTPGKKQKRNSKVFYGRKKHI